MHFWECTKLENREPRKQLLRSHVCTSSSSHFSLQGKRWRRCEAKTIARLHKETASTVEDPLPDDSAKYTVQYVSHYLPEQGLDCGWNNLGFEAQPLKHIISQRLFLPPTILNQICVTPNTGAFSACRLPKVENVEREAKFRRSPLIQTEKQTSSVPLNQAIKEKHHGKNYITLELGGKDVPNLTLTHETRLSSSLCKATTWRLEKYQAGKATSSKEKESSFKDDLDDSRSISDGRRKKENESSSLGNAKSGINRPHLAMLSSAKRIPKTVLLKHCEDGEISSPRSLLCTRPKMSKKSLLCHSESKFSSKKHRHESLNHRLSVQDFPAPTETISFHA